MLRPWRVAAGSDFACAMVAFGLTNELRTGFLTEGFWLDVAMMVTFAAFSLLFLYFLGRSYIFGGGSVLCI
jgi:hypothetical protein